MSKLRAPEHGPKRVRTYLGGELVADTKRVMLVWENPHYPQYYFPIADVHAELVPTATTSHSPSRGDAAHFTVKTANHSAVDGAWQYPESRMEELRGLVRFEWDAMGGWFEEDEEIHTHPRDPYSRVDILDSSRHIRVVVNGTTVAESNHPKLLFETEPPDAVLPAKGRCAHGPARSDRDRVALPLQGSGPVLVDRRPMRAVRPDLAWSYPAPLPESQKVAGLVAFYNEHVDHIIDGEPVERPHTPFS